MNGKLLWILICAGLSVILSIWFYRKQRIAEQQKVQHYISSEATIIDISPARMSRYGMKPPRYGLTFMATDGKQYTQHNCTLSKTYKVNDKLTIFYDPGNPFAPVTDTK